MTLAGSRPKCQAVEGRLERRVRPHSRASQRSGCLNAGACYAFAKRTVATTTTKKMKTGIAKRLVRQRFVLCT